MHVTFHGAVREVTGSMHMLSDGPDRILLDCGMFQGRRKESERKNRVIPFDPAIVTNVILSHAHIDHSGRIPLLTSSGFAGRVICTRATQDACNYLLRDSAHIQESDANYLNYKTVRHALRQMKYGGSNGDRKIKKLLKTDRNRINTEAISEWMTKLRLEAVEPMYTMADAEESLNSFDGVPYATDVTVGKKLTCRLYDAGHIIGSAVSVVRSRKKKRTRTVCYTGDIGRFDCSILKDPTLMFAEEDREIDLMVMESTYGDRRHEPVADLKPKLQEVLSRTFERGGCVLIPSFAFGRTQELLYALHELYDAGAVAKVPVFVDSPLAVNMTRVYGEHPETYDRDARQAFLRKGKNPFWFQQVSFVTSVEDSMALMRQTGPHIVIASSGMCEAGRILHHLRNRIHNARNTVLVVGFMAQHTLGRRILDLGSAYRQAGRKEKPPVVRMLNKTYPLAAEVVKIGGFSAHADYTEMLRFLKTGNLKIDRIAIVHGEEQQSLAFADRLAQEGFNVSVPKVGESITV
jgi:metallo-beta-lactamase family protein